LGQVDLNGFNQTFAGISDNSGPGTIINNGASASTLTINTGTNTAASFSTAGSIVDGGNVLNVLKTGKGNQTFSSPTVTYSGTTTINDGRLTFASANPVNTAILVASGGALAGEGTTTNSLTFQANSTLVVDPLTAGSFTANTIDASAAPIKVFFTTAAPPNTATLLLTAVNGFKGSAANFQSAGSRGGIFYLANGNTQLMFEPGTVSASLVWKGNNPLNPAFWDTVTTTNWSNGGAPDLFYPSDSVTFDDSASTYSVAIQGTSVQPIAVTVNSTNDYTFTGVIAGGASLTKGGTGTLFLNNNNSHTGPTVITNGGVAMQTSGALGSAASGTVISTHGTLDLNTGAALANTINLGAEVLTISGAGFGGFDWLGSGRSARKVSPASRGL
jgi:autotransporter-associated beta strand protein